ncbi:MAG: Uma2 family endonuclease [Gemmatirosa sp.]
MDAPRLRTADEYGEHPLGQMPGELVRGVMHVMSPAGGPHGVVIDNLLAAVGPYVRAHRLGRTFADNVGFQLTIPGATADTVRSPDVAFVRAERLPAGGIGPGWVRVAPDLVVEVRSPDNRPPEIEARVADYFAAGTALIWIVDPDARIVERRTPDGPLPTLAEPEVLDAGDVLPAFSVPVADLFDGLARAP